MVNALIPGELGRLPAYGSNAPTTGRIPMYDSATGKATYVTSDQIASGASAVDGPASATDNAVARFDGTTGKIIQNSAVTIADTTGAIASGNITTTGAGGSVFNSTSLDADFAIKKLTSGNAIAYDAGTVDLQLATTTIGLTGITTQTGNYTHTGAGAVIFNNGATDTDFTVKALTSGNAIAYDAGTSAITMAATTIGATGAVTITGAVSQSGSTTYTTAASGVTLKQGANGRVGTFILNGSTPVSVSNSSITANSVVFFCLKTVGGTVSVTAPNIVTITPGVGFNVVGLVSDTSTYNYAIIESAV